MNLCKGTAVKLLLVLLCLGVLAGSAGAASTASLEVIRYGVDADTGDRIVLANETVTWEQMKEKLPVIGDGTTHVYTQGPVFDGDPWDPTESVNLADWGALRGTKVLDLASLVGGIPEDSTVRIVASDHFGRNFSSSYILDPPTNMGPLFVAWETTDSAYGSGTQDVTTGFTEGMRLFFYPQDAKHVFGATDMLNCMPEPDRYNYSDSGKEYPSTSGLSVKFVNRIFIYTDETEYTPAEPEFELTGYDRAVSIDDGMSTIPADRISSKTDTVIANNSLAGMLNTAFENDVSFYHSAGSSTDWFNLDTLFDRMHKKNSYEWTVEINGAPQLSEDIPDWSKYILNDGDRVRLVYTEDDFTLLMRATNDARLIYDNAILPEPGSYMDGNEDGGQTEFDSRSVAGLLKALDFTYTLHWSRNNNAYTLNNLTDLQTGKTYPNSREPDRGWWAYKGDYLTGEKLNADIVLDEGSTLNVYYSPKGAEASYEYLIQITVGDTVPSQATWPVMLRGAVEMPLYYSESAAARSSFSSAEGYHKAEAGEYIGVPLRSIVAMFDDIDSVSAQTHYVYNQTRAELGYDIILTNGTGEVYTIPQGVLTGDDYILSCNKSGVSTVLTLLDKTGTVLLEDIREISADVGQYELQPKDWMINLCGYINGSVTDVFLYGAVDRTAAVSHNLSWTDTSGDVYHGMGITTMLGWVDDEHPHGLNPDTLSGGCTITVTGAEGSSAEFDSDLIKDDTTGAIFALYKNGERIAPYLTGKTIDENAKNVADVTSVTFTNYREPPEVESLSIVKKYDNGTVIDTKTISWEEMRDTLPVIGNGETYYSLQGPILTSTDPVEIWDMDEEFPPIGSSPLDPRFKVHDPVKGTPLKDLVELVGGMEPGDQFKIIATDGFNEIFTDGYRYVYNPDVRMGTAFLAWSNNNVDGPSGYNAMFRIFFTSDDNIFSLADMNLTMDPDDYGWYAGNWPTPAQISVSKINRLEVIVPTKQTEFTYKIQDDNVTIPAEVISGRDAEIEVTGDSLIAAIYESLDGAELFYKDGETDIFFNLNSYDGHTHKSPAKTDKWYAYIDGTEVTAGDWSTVHLNGGEELRITFDNVSDGTRSDYYIDVLSNLPVLPISEGTVTIPVSALSTGNTGPADVPANSLIAALNGLKDVVFYKGGNQGMYFNLDTYDGHTHKKPTTEDKWYVYIDEIEVTDASWATVTVYDGQRCRLEFNESSTGKVYDYEYLISGGTPLGWTLTLVNGETKTVLTQKEFETLARSYVSYNCTDEDGVWKGIPLYVLAGVVDDDDPKTFNTKLAEKGYSIRVIDSAASYKINFDSGVIADDNTILVTNTLNGLELPETTESGKGCYPLQMKGVNPTSGQHVGNIATIELVDVPDEFSLLHLSGKMTRFFTEDEYAGSSHHFVTWNGYEGMPLYTLIATIDDLEKGVPGEYSGGHFTLNTSLIQSSPYSIVINSTTGKTLRIDARDIAAGKAAKNNYILATTLNKNPVANGPMTLVGENVTGEFGNIKTIELEGPAYQGEDWYILLNGPEFGIYLSKSEVESLITSESKKSFTDPSSGEVWSGVRLSELIGYVDDYTVPAFNTELAETGYTVILTAGDGYSSELDSKQLAADTENYIIANCLNGAALTGKHYPLRLIGGPLYDTENSKFTNVAVSGLAKIELKEFQPPTEPQKITVVRYAENGNVLKTVTLNWPDIIADPAMYPVIGDGNTDYGFQGLATAITEPKYGQGVGWDLEEEYLNGNWKVQNKVKGIAVSSLTDLVGGMSENDQITFIASDGWQNILEYNNIYDTDPRLGTAFLAWYADGKIIPEYSEGPRLFFTSKDQVFSSADMYYTIAEEHWHYNSGFASPGGLSAQKVATIEIRPKTKEWSLELAGAVNTNMTKGYFESGLACLSLMGDESMHIATYTDAKGRVWSGMPLWILNGFVDDENSHMGKSYNRTLALEGYNITIIGADGSETIIDSRNAHINSNYIIANTLNGALLTEDDGWPLRLVGANVTGGMQIKGIKAIHLDLDPIVVPGLEYDPVIEPDTADVTVIVNNTEYKVSGNTVLGALVRAGLEPVLGDKKYAQKGILLFDGLKGYENSEYAEWTLSVGDTVIDGFSDVASAINTYEVKPGDVITGTFLGNDGITVSEEFTITIGAAPVVIPASAISGSDSDMPVPSDSLIAVIYENLEGAELFYKIGETATYFNLNAYDGHIHKENGKWHAYINGAEVTEGDWSTVLVPSSAKVTLTFLPTSGEGYDYPVVGGDDPVPEYSYTLSPGEITIPEAKIAYDTSVTEPAPVTVSRDTLIAALYKTLDEAEYFYKIKDAAPIFNLNTYDGHTHKKNGRWHAYLNEIEVTADDWRTVEILGGQTILLSFAADDKTYSNYTIKVKAQYVPPVVDRAMLEIVQVSSDGTVLNNTTVSFEWMKENLPIIGDATTHVYLQGPVFNGDLWDPTESVNIEDKDMGAVRGTAVKDLAGLVGGIPAGSTVKIQSADGWYKNFSASYILSPEDRMGPMFVSWETNGENVSTGYPDGMRLLWMPDTSVNPWGYHVFGVADMKATMPENEWYFYDDQYPTTTGISAQKVAKITIYTPEIIPTDTLYNATTALSPLENVIIGEYSVAEHTVLGAIVKSGMTPVLSNKKWESDGILLLDGLNSYEGKWSILVNGKTEINGYNAETKDRAVNIYKVSPGDVITGSLKNKTSDSVLAEFTITAGEATETLYSGTTTAAEFENVMTNGIIHKIDGNTVLGMIARSNMTPILGDKKWESDEILLLDGLNGYEGKWSILVNGKTEINGYNATTKDVAVNIYKVHTTDIITGTCVQENFTVAEFTITAAIPVKPELPNVIGPDNTIDHKSDPDNVIVNEAEKNVEIKDTKSGVGLTVQYENMVNNGGKVTGSIENVIATYPEMPMVAEDENTAKLADTVLTVVIDLGKTIRTDLPTFTNAINQEVKDRVEDIDENDGKTYMVGLMLQADVTDDFNKDVKEVRLTFDGISEEWLKQFTNADGSRNICIIHYAVDGTRHILTEFDLKKNTDGTYKLTVTSDHGFSDYVLAGYTVTQAPSYNSDSSGDDGDFTPIKSKDPVVNPNVSVEYTTPTPVVTQTTAPTTVPTTDVPQTNTTATPEPTRTPAPFGMILLGLSGAALILSAVRRH